MTIQEAEFLNEIIGEEPEKAERRATRANNKAKSYRNSDRLDRYNNDVVYKPRRHMLAKHQIELLGGN